MTDAPRSDDLAATLGPVVARVAEGEGVELVEALFRGKTLVVTIDREGGVRMTDCENVSRQLGVVLDVEDLIPFAYNLEVTSPGLDRLLLNPRDFDRAKGHLVRVIVRGESGRPVPIRGTLLSFDERSLTLRPAAQKRRRGARKQEQTYTISIERKDILEAKQDVEFRR